MAEGVCLHIVSNDGLHVSRVLKEATSFLRHGVVSRVLILAKWRSGLPEDEGIAPALSLQRVKLVSRLLPRHLACQIFKEMEWRHRVVRRACALQPQIIVCHSAPPLRTAVQASRRTGAALIYDAHELETERAEMHGARKRLFSYLEARFIPQCNAVLCVSDLIADWYAQRYRMPRPLVVRNIPDRRIQAEFEGSNLLRERFGISRAELLFIYQGALAPGRRVEETLQVFAQAKPDRHLVFMGFGPLEKVVRNAAAQHRNIHFHPAVEPGEILKYTAGADVGFAAHLEPTCLNHRYALPNKFFEYLLAGLPVWVNEVHEEMASLVRTHGFGWVTPYETRGMTEWVNSLSREEVQAKRELASIAGGIFSWANEEAVLLEACHSIGRLSAPRQASREFACSRS